MAKKRIYELAKELVDKKLVDDSKTLNAEIVKLLQENGSEVKNHSSSITEDEEAIVLKHFSKNPVNSKEKKKEDKPVKNMENEKTEKPSQAAQGVTPAETKKSDAPAEVKKNDIASENKKNDAPADNKKQAKPEQKASMRRSEGVIRSRNGASIRFKVMPDDMLMDIDTQKILPLKMTDEGIYDINKKQLIGKNGPSNNQQASQNRQGQDKAGARPQRPMTQVFDGRSEKDKRAAMNASKNRPNKDNAIGTALGNKVKELASQIITEEEQQPANKQPKKQEVPVTENNAPAKKEEKANTAPVAEKVPVNESNEKNTAAPSGNENAQTEEKPVNRFAIANEVKTVKVLDNIFANGRNIEPAKPASNQDRRNGDRNYNRDGRNGQERGNYNRDGRNDRSQGERGNYNRDNRNGQERGNYNRDTQERGSYNRDGQERGNYNRDGGYNRNFQDRPQGERGSYNRDGRPSFNRDQQGSRPGFQNRDARPGFNRDRAAGGPAFPDKDEGTQRRVFTKKNDNKSSGGSIRSELANELGKGQRAESIKDRKKDKNDRRDRDYDDDGLKTGKNKKDPNRKGAFQKPVAKATVQEDEIKTIVVPEVITIKDLADKMKQPSAAIIKKLFLAGKMVTVNSEVTYEEAEEIALDYEIICEKEVKVNIIEELLKETEEDPATLVKRPPVVCVMGHVDHGKTSLLDAIRKTNVTAREAGGITQHIGAYMVEINGQKITFLDTPGHEAFTSMRMRGAQSTDIAILVIAADDGVMPQTVEAINHAKAAGVQIIVAVNKIDKPGANIDRVKQELTEHELVAEDWGGDTVFVPVSAKTGEGIENLLEMVLLTADVLELKANPDRKARGIVIEAKLDKGRGPVATVLVQKGTLNVGDNVVIGAVHGKVRAMTDDKGRKVKTATPSTPVELLGLDGVPQAGETMLDVADEKEARTIAEAFIAQSKEQLIAETKRNMTLDSLYSQIQAGEVKELNIIIKADVMGSVEAVKQSLLKLNNEEVVVRVIHGGVGNINESDANLASASNAIIIGFNVKPDNTAKEIADRENIDIRLYRVIYDAINDIEMAMKGMLKPIYEEKVIGHAEVRQLFKASGLGIIAGSFVLDGKIIRGCSARISREGNQIFDGPLASLKRFKDDVKEVAAGYECGLVFEKFNDLAELDQVEFYMMVEVPRT